RCRHSMLLEKRNEDGRRNRSSESLYACVQLVNVSHSRITAGEARVCFELGMPDRCKHSAGKLFGGRAYRDMTIRGFVDPEWSQARDRPPGSVRLSACSR